MTQEDKIELLSLLQYVNTLSSPTYWQTCPFGGWANSNMVHPTDYQGRLTEIHKVVKPKHDRLLEEITKNSVKEYHDKNTMPLENW